MHKYLTLFISLIGDDKGDPLFPSEAKLRRTARGEDDDDPRSRGVRGDPKNPAWAGDPGLLGSISLRQNYNGFEHKFRNGRIVKK